MDLKGRKVLVIGSGISGIGAAKLLCQVGAKPYIFDENKDLSPEKLQAKIPADMQVQCFCQELPESIKETVEIVVPSPGVPVDTPFIAYFKKRGIQVWGEIELAYLFEKGRLVAITGTNGKTTTTALTGQIMEDCYGKAYVVGNIGNPYTTVALETTENSVTVAEISSFQLETVASFHPEVSAILNITPDHLNRHHTMEAYVKAKESIAQNQGPEDTCVLNYEDEYTREFGKNLKTKVLYFSSERVLEEGLYLKDNEIFFARNGKTEKLIRTEQMRLLGKHNMENVMAAIGIAFSFGVPMDSILQTVREFRGVEHRIEYVATKEGVEYYNDSKGTNIDAAIKGIQAMVKPTILIGGGYDKQGTYDEWIESFQGKVKYLVLLGQTKEVIAECAKKHGFYQTILVDTLEEAVHVSREKAEPGDAVLLSPACASWGMFPNFEVRGNKFKELVNSIKG